MSTWLLLVVFFYPARECGATSGESSLLLVVRYLDLGSSDAVCHGCLGEGAPATPTCNINRTSVVEWISVVLGDFISGWLFVVFVGVEFVE